MKNMKKHKLWQALALPLLLLLVLGLAACTDQAVEDPTPPPTVEDPTVADPEASEPEPNEPEPVEQAEPLIPYYQEELLLLEAAERGIVVTEEEARALMLESREKTERMPANHNIIKAHCQDAGITEDDYWEGTISIYQSIETLERLETELKEEYRAAYPEDYSVNAFFDYFNETYLPALFAKYHAIPMEEAQ